MLKNGIILQVTSKSTIELFYLAVAKHIRNNIRHKSAFYKT